MAWQAVTFAWIGRRREGEFRPSSDSSCLRVLPLGNGRAGRGTVFRGFRCHQHDGDSTCVRPLPPLRSPARCSPPRRCGLRRGRHRHPDRHHHDHHADGREGRQHELGPLGPPRSAGPRRPAEEAEARGRRASARARWAPSRRDGPRHRSRDDRFAQQRDRQRHHRPGHRRHHASLTSAAPRRPLGPCPRGPRSSCDQTDGIRGICRRGRAAEIRAMALGDAA